MTQLLPDEFAALERWADAWALPTQNLRWDKRLASMNSSIELSIVSLSST